MESHHGADQEVRAEYLPSLFHPYEYRLRTTSDPSAEAQSRIEDWVAEHPLGAGLSVAVNPALHCRRTKVKKRGAVIISSSSRS
jgi:hypothetical protein